MKTLLLMRHAKADRAQAGVADIDRALNERGRRAAPMIAAEIARHGLSPDHVLVSEARRTRETWQLAAPKLGREPSAADIRGDLYAAPAARILGVVKSLGPAPSRVLVIGHNPGIEELALRLASRMQKPDAARALDQLKAKFPTSALAVFDIDISSWEDLAPSTAALTLFITPAMLED